MQIVYFFTVALLVIVKDQFSHLVYLNNRGYAHVAR